MIDKFVPDMHYQSIYRIDYENLYNKGIRLIIFDLDNTIAPLDASVAAKEATELMVKIREMGITPVLMSNSGRERVTAFRNSLVIDSCANARKPFSKKYFKIMKLYDRTPEQIACVGDQLLTDVYGANRLNMTSILVNPMSKKDRKITYVNRVIEKVLFFIMDKRDIFKRGKYYE